MVYRIFVEKKTGLDNEAKGLLSEAKNLLGIENLKDIRLFNRYDAENITDELFQYAVKTVFSEPQLDDISSDLDISDAYVFAVEHFRVSLTRELTLQHSVFRLFHRVSVLLSVQQRFMHFMVI